MNNRVQEYVKYHIDSAKALDIDTQVEAIKYLCERFELNGEQRLWLCFLFSTNYCVPTTYFMYNEFPDFAVVDVNRLDRWWCANRDKLIFQTDRAWIRRLNKFVDVFVSYREIVKKLSKGTMSQRDAIFSALNCPKTEYEAYLNLTKNMNILLFGRFTYFLYSELLKHIGNIPVGVKFDLGESESSRNGLVFVLGLEDKYYTGRHGKKLDEKIVVYLNKALEYIAGLIGSSDISDRHKTLWSIETTLCAYKKHKLNGKRWVGYYIDRMRKEIIKIESKTNKAANGGISWRPLWEFRTETYEMQYLNEKK